MALRIRYPYITNHNLTFSIERMSDGKLYDFVAKQFVTQTNTMVPVYSLPEFGGQYFKGQYRASIDQTPVTQFTDGEYNITIHDTMNGYTLIDNFSKFMYNGDELLPSYTILTKIVYIWGQIKALGKALGGVYATNLK